MIMFRFTLKLDEIHSNPTNQCFFCFPTFEVLILSLGIRNLRKITLHSIVKPKSKIACKNKHCKLVRSELLLFCVTTDIYLVFYLWCQIAWRHFYTAYIWHFLAQIRETILQCMTETERPNDWVYLYDIILVFGRIGFWSWLIFRLSNWPPFFPIITW